MNYPEILKQYGINQGYCLGLETYHRLKSHNSLAKHYSKLAIDFNKKAVKIKSRAVKNGFKHSYLNEFIFFGINLGKRQASERYSNEQQ
jgi:hypothetical protein